MKLEMDANAKTVIMKLWDHVFSKGASFTLKIELRPDLSTADANKFKIELEVR